jgi:hypothetical protein
MPNPSHNSHIWVLKKRRKTHCPNSHLPIAGPLSPNHRLDWTTAPPPVWVRHFIIHFVCILAFLFPLDYTKNKKKTKKLFPLDYTIEPLIIRTENELIEEKNKKQKNPERDG